MSRSAEHDIDMSQIDDLDEISGDQQQALVWCRSHRKYEWHWIERADIHHPRVNHHHSAD